MCGLLLGKGAAAIEPRTQNLHSTRRGPPSKKGTAGRFRFSPHLFHTLGMAKRKRAKFSAAKAVKANARERVGQPPPARRIDDTPKTGRAAKHKAKLEDLMQREE
jgi:hypothetical protein